MRAAALGLGVSAAATWFLRTVSTRVQRRFRDKVTIALESHVARLQASVATIAHHERPDYLDRLSMLRNQVFVLDHMYMSLFSTCGWILRLGVTVALLVSIHPALVLLAVFALPTVLTSTWRPGGRARRAGARRAGQPPGPPPVHARDDRAAGQGSARHRHRRAPRSRERRAAWERWYGPVAAARWGSAAWHTLAWAVFGAAYVGAVVFVSSGLGAPAGDVLLVLAAGSRLSAYIGATVGEIGFLRGFWMDGSRRLAWLEDYAASLIAHRPTCRCRRGSRRGIRFEHVSFAYPGTDRAGARRRDRSTLPAGAVVAIVGENGAGKTTLVKLLAQDVRADVGRDPRRRHAARAHAAPTSGARAWPARSRTSSASSSAPATPSASATCRAWTTSRRWSTAVDRAGADDVVARLPSGLETQLGPTWPGGVEVSFGQWQKLALARGFMRDRPLLLVLDEPTAALDAETEHALFERYAAAARGGTGDTRRQRPHHDPRLAPLLDRPHGRSHRRARRRPPRRVGTHEELMAKGGQYAELYGIQAAAYR